MTHVSRPLVISDNLKIKNLFICYPQYEGYQKCCKFLIFIPITQAWRLKCHLSPGGYTFFSVTRELNDLYVLKTFNLGLKPVRNCQSRHFITLSHHSSIQINSGDFRLKCIQVRFHCKVRTTVTAILENSENLRELIRKENY